MPGKTLEEIDGVVWDARELESYPHWCGTVVTAYRLRKKPLAEFTREDLRFMIRQGDSLDVLVPMAIKELHQDPLAAGDLHKGDLLAALLSQGEWLSARPALAKDVMKLALRAVQQLSDSSTVRQT